MDTSTGGDSSGGTEEPEEGGSTEGDNSSSSSDTERTGFFNTVKKGIESIIGFFKNIIVFFSDLLSYLNPFSDNFILNGVLDYLVDLLSYINPFSDNFILKGVLEFLGNILSYLNPFSDNFLGNKIIELLGDLLKFLFIPSEERINALTNTVSSKFNFIESIKESINALKNIINNIGNSPTLSIDVNSKYYSGSLVYMDLNWYTPFKPYGDVVITGFVYLFFLWRLFIHLPNIINGSGGEIVNVVRRSDKL